MRRMSTKPLIDIVDEMSLWFTLVNKGLDPETVKFYQELADINGKSSSLTYLIEAIEGFKDFLSQEPDIYEWKEDEFYFQ
jgi:hypothetical protein